MEKRSNILKELKEQAPFLAKLKAQEKGEGFTVPENYFEDLQDQVFTKIREEQNEIKAVRKTDADSFWGRIVLVLQQLFQPRFALGFAGVLLVVVFAVWFFPARIDSRQFVSLEDLSEEELYSYVEANIDDFDTQVILEATDESVSLDLLLPASMFESPDFDQVMDEFFENADPSLLNELL